MKHIESYGRTTFILVGIITLLIIIAFGLFQKNTLAPTIDEEILGTPQEISTEDVTDRSPRITETTPATEVVPVIEQISLDEQDITALEEEVTALQNQIDDTSLEELILQ